MKHEREKCPSILITRGRVITPFEEIPGADVLIRGERIEAVGRRLRPASGAVTIDAKGCYVAPGLIDLHTQGGCGHDVWDATPESLMGWSRCNARHGVTSYLITTGYGTSGYNFMAEHIDLAGVAAKPLGVYLESPFCSMIKRGGIDASRVGPVSMKMLDKICRKLGRSLRMMTVAPERKGAIAMIRELRRRSIIAAIGHTDCTYDQALEAMDAGATHVTHCFNTMRSLHHREPGPLPALLTDPRVTIELVLDGHHIHPAVISMAVRLRGTDHTCVITDNMRVAGLPDGNYTFEKAGREIRVTGGVPRLADGTIAGSTLTMDRALANVVKFTGLTVREALPMLTATPARAVGYGDRKGQLARGFDADVVLFNNRFEIQRTIVSGRTVYLRGKDVPKG